MSTHATIEELEALARGELTTSESVSLDTHLAECTDCQRELSWIRAESGLLSRRPRPSLPAQLWRNIEAQLPGPVTAQAAAQVAALRSTNTPRPSRPRSQVAQWFAVAAAAAAMLVVYSVGGAPLLKLRHGVASLFGDSTSGPQVVVKIGEHASEAPLTTTVKVSGAITLRLATRSADVEAVAGQRDRVVMEVTDSFRKTIELRTENPGELRAFFDANDHLDSGHVHLELPPGSRLEVTTASGALSISGIGGDVHLQTASGDVHISDARKLELETASGDINVENFSGAARIHTTSGDAHVIRGSAPLAALDWSSASGELELTGRCATDCRANLHTVSGDVDLHLTSDSACTVSFQSVSGDLEGPGSTKDHDDDDDDVIPHQERTVRIGSGDGAIRVNTVSGDLEIVAR